MVFQAVPIFLREEAEAAAHERAWLIDESHSNKDSVNT